MAPDPPFCPHRTNCASLRRAGPASPLVIGATAGVRDGLRSGAFTASDLDAFKRSVHDRLGPHARFVVINGEQVGVRRTPRPVLRRLRSTAAGAAGVCAATN